MNLYTTANTKMTLWTFI